MRVAYGAGMGRKQPLVRIVGVVNVYLPSDVSDGKRRPYAPKKLGLVGVGVL
jgi:hypothetical protein